MALHNSKRISFTNKSSNLFLDILKVAPLVELDERGLSIRNKTNVSSLSNSSTSLKAVLPPVVELDVPSTHHTDAQMSPSKSPVSPQKWQSNSKHCIKRRRTSEQNKALSVDEMIEFDAVDMTSGHQSVGWNKEDDDFPGFIPISAEDWRPSDLASLEEPEIVSMRRSNRFKKTPKKSKSLNAKTSKSNVSLTPNSTPSKSPRRRRPSKNKVKSSLPTDVIVIDDESKWSGGEETAMEPGGFAEIVFVGESSPPKSKKPKKEIIKGNSNGNIDLNRTPRSAKKLAHGTGKKLAAKASSTAASVVSVKSSVEPVMEVESTSSQLVNMGSAFPRPLKELSAGSPINCFVSRLRPTQFTPPVPSGSYPLCGLRYFEEIKGTDIVSVASAYRPVNLKLVSYNVLSHSVMQTTNRLYRHLSGAMKNLWSWETRWNLLKEEFARLQADVICMQEVEDVHYHSFYLPFFQNLGIDGVFIGRGGVKPDGCAVFYSRSRLKIRKNVAIHYNLGSPPLNFDNVGQIIAFDIIGTRSVVCVSNTHLLFNQRRGDTKLSQLAYLIANMHEMERQIRRELSPADHFVGHFLCGDFNLEPFSAIYKFIVGAKINVSDFKASLLHRSLENLIIDELQNERSYGGASVNLGLMRITNTCTLIEQNKDRQQGWSILQCDTTKSSKLTHPFRFASAYEHLIANSKREISTYHEQNSELCPDFIFYTVAETKSDDNPIAESFIRLRQRLTLPCFEDLLRTCGSLPNEQAGSDHLPLCAQFELLCK